MSINRVCISGNLTRDPEYRQGNVELLRLGIAVNDRRKDQSGEWKDFPNYVDCVLFGKRASSLSTILKKGMKVCIDGSLRYSSWEKDGQKRSKLEVVVGEIDIMQRSDGSQAYQNQQQANYTPTQQYGPQNVPQVQQQPYQGQQQYQGNGYGQQFYPNGYQR